MPPKRKLNRKPQQIPLPVEKIINVIIPNLKLFATNFTTSHEYFIKKLILQYDPFLHRNEIKLY